MLPLAVCKSFYTTKAKVLSCIEQWRCFQCHQREWDKPRDGSQLGSGLQYGMPQESMSVMSTLKEWALQEECESAHT